MPLRVLHIAAYGPEAWAYGGIPRVVAALTQGLAERGHHVTLATTDACDRGSRLPVAASRFTAPGVAASGSVSAANGVVRRIFPNVSNAAAYHLQAFMPRGLRRYLHREAGTFDVAHLHGCHNLPGVFAARALRAAGVPFLVSPNGTAPIFERRLVAKRVFQRLGGWRVLAHAARVIAVSDAEAAQLSALGVGSPRIAFLPNPLHPEDLAWRPSPGRFRGRAGLGTSPLVLFLGKITPRKQVATLVDAFAAAGASAHLVLAGNDLGGLDEARRRVAAHGLGARVHETGLLTGTDRLDALADADLVVYAGGDEVFGLVACEALLAGTPAIVADDSGCAEIVGKVGGGLVVPPGDAVALARALRRVLEHASAWRGRALDAGREVRRLFNTTRVSADLEAIYTSVLGTSLDRRTA